MSFDKAFCGEMYNTSVSLLNCPVLARYTGTSMAHKNAARVLPEPVGRGHQGMRAAANRRLCLNLRRRGRSETTTEPVTYGRMEAIKRHAEHYLGLNI